MTTQGCNWISPGLVSANGFSFVPGLNPKQMTAALNLGPIAVAIDASSIEFQTYTGGIFTNATACGTELNHAVTVVGYNGNNDPPYFIVRNSWGSSWGDYGYFYIAITPQDGVCGINMEPSYPNLLLLSDSDETLFTYIILAAALVLLIPCTCIAIKRRSREIEFFHPG